MTAKVCSLVLSWAILVCPLVSSDGASSVLVSVGLSQDLVQSLFDVAQSVTLVLFVLAQGCQIFLNTSW